MNYVNETVAIGIVMPGADGNDEMQVMQGVIKKDGEKLFFESKGHEPFEMADGWLEKLKPVAENMGPEFQGAKYCLVLAAASPNGS